MFYSVQKRRAAARVGLQAKRKRESRNTLAARFCYTLLQTKTRRRFALLQPLGNVATAACVVKPMGVAARVTIIPQKAALDNNSGENGW